jgi:hypothetical protein
VKREAQPHAREVPPPEKTPNTFLGGGGFWGGGGGAENNTHTRIRSPDRPVLSESLYRLSYPGFPIHWLKEKFWPRHMSSITRRTLPNDIKIRPHITELTAKRLQIRNVERVWMCYASCSYCRNLKVPHHQRPMVQRIYKKKSMRYEIL